MAFTPGTRLGPYEIADAIGAGGMGEVYRATDANLKRDVAIKVLPQSFAGDAERLARFQREAEVLASLNHVNIAHIYGLERSDGVTALAMELVDGPTLADRIGQGPIRVEEALDIARQIAEALEAAHARGIVHRDLKPANVKLTPDGVVKVLDFGIAKALDTRAISGTPAPSLTTPAMTEAGIVLGTAQYMSPEQARGKPVDQRADIWAFGCLLYEMVTGQPAFAGEDVTVVLARVLERAADLSALPPAVSAAVQQTIKLCLQKDPKKRIADIRDVRLALEGAFETQVSATPSSTSTATSGGRLAWIIASLAVLVAAGLAVPAVRHLNEVPPALAPSSVARLQFSLPRGVELFTLATQGLAVSPDGSRLVFIGSEGADRRIFVRRIDEFAAVPLRGTETATECCRFSPDGRSLSFVAADGNLKRVSLADGLVTQISAGSDFVGHSWGSDDIIVLARSQALWRVPSSGGEPTQITMEAPGSVAQNIAWPAILPGAEAVLFASSDIGSDDWKIESIRLASGERHTVIERGTLPLYVPSGRLLFYRDEELLAAPFDVNTQRITGRTVRVLENIPATASGVPLVAVSAAGTLVYAPISASRLVWVSRLGAEEPVTDTRRIYMNPRLDPSGRWVLVQTGDLWLHDLARSTFTRVDAEVASYAYQVITPNGDSVVFKTNSGLSWHALDGSGRGGAIAGTTTNDYPALVSPDGERLLFVRLSPETSGDIYEASLGGDDSEIRPFLQTPAYEGSARLSPNGQWLAYASNDSGRLEVYLRPYPAPDRRWQVSTQGGTQPIWNPNGQELFYRDGDRMMAVAVSYEDAEPVLGDPELLFERPYAYGTGITIPNYAISADGERFLMVKEDAGVGQLNLILNWTDELERLTPSD
jgi:Tol biopolymer transport system component